ncbi:YDG domain-containing protein [Achromobacter sp. Bel]|uniref:YDG domain-containing protein n=1 Tax=Achromobacter sp. Bel TaxID=2727415 RepID=UPI00145EF97D|nr:YDG domain-containing protein [Achromobacter sp. Bel]NMK45142.1 filamentous hemagglutinin N-terminal domain-containing protein [Achromobacter sp. Bel]
MKKPSLNHIFRLVWNDALGVYVPVAEHASARRKRSSGSAVALSAAMLLSGPAWAADLPTGGNVVAGAGSISQNGTAMTINQQTGKMAVDWQSFSIGKGNSVTFKQPGRDSVALNRVLGPDVSVIQGALNANGQVFLVNPNGVVFTPTAQVNVGGIVASTLNISTQDFLAGNYRFEGASSNAIINQGNITAAPGGSIALIAAKITNIGNLAADKGNVLLGAGSRVKLDLGGPVKIEVEQGAIDALIEQGGAIRADGGMVYLTAKAAGDLASTVINHTGITQAKTLATGENGKIVLLGDMVNDRIAVAGKLDASAPDGGKGGFVETSAAKVTVAAGAVITTKAVSGQHGSWLIDPTDFTVSAGTNGQTDSGIGADTLAANLNNGNVELQTVASGAQAGNINVNAGVTWSADTKLTLSAHGNILLNAPITATGTNAGLALNHGGYKQDGSVAAGTDYRVNSPVTLSGANSTFAVNGNAYTLIRSVAQLSTVNDVLTGRYALAQDLDAAGQTFSQSLIGTSSEFRGAFDGLGHTISNLKGIQSYSGLFAFVEATGDIRNLGIVNTDVAGFTYAGGLVGYNRGKLDNVYVTGKVTGGDNGLGSGGLVGVNFGTISNAYSSGTLEASQFPMPTGQRGGLVGVNYGAITNSYSTMLVKEPMFPVMQSGALVGANYGTITGSFAASTDAAGTFYTGASMTKLVGGSQGVISPTSGMKTYQQLTQLATFKDAGWDIDAAGGTGATWRIYEGKGGPLLRGLLKQVTVSLADKVYDGRVSGGVGYVASQPGAQLDGSLNYTTNSKNAGVYRLADGTLTVDGGLYSNQQGYDIVYADGLALNVLKKGVSVGFTASDKTYDGTQHADVNGMVGADMIAGDILGVGGTGSFSDKNAGAGKTVNIGGVALSGFDADNYFITTGSTATATASITPREVTGSVTLSDKVYDGNTVVSANGSLTGLLATDSYSFYLQFVDKNVGTNKQVRFVLSGLDANNYVVGAGLNLLTASITPKALTAALTASNKIYDGSTSAAVSGGLTGVLVGDQVSLASSGNFLDKNVGIGKSVLLAGSLTGLDALNYTLAFNAVTTATISPKALTGAITAAGKTYDGTRDAVTSGQLTGVVQGDAVALDSSGLFADKNAGVGKSVAVNGLLSGADAANYTLSFNAATVATITPKALTGAITAAGKTYDGTLTASTDGTLAGKLAGDSVSLSTTGVFADKNAGVGKQVNVTGVLTGVDAQNYTVAYNPTAFADIAVRQLTGALGALDKVYDGTSLASVTGVNSLNVVSGDLLNVSGSFGDKNVANGKAVTYVLGGVDAGNYALGGGVSQGTASISRKTITGAISASGKVYDGGVLATTSGGLSGVVVGDSVALNSSGSFLDKNVGNGKTVNVSGSLNGLDASNYTLVANSTATANITPKAITGALTAAGKVYDGSRDAATTGTLNGVVQGDNVAVNATGLFGDKNVGNGKLVAVNGVLTGVDAGNYLLSTNATTLADITPKALTGAITAAGKTYDGTTAAATSGTLNGVVVGDAVALSTTGAFADKNAGVGKRVDVNGTLTGVDAGNYTVASNATTAATITPKAITGAITATGKTYDGTNAASTSGSLAGQILTDAVALSTTGAFTDKNVGNGKTVNVGGSLTGLDAGNYILAANATTTANITPKAITGALTAAGKVYDGSRDAAATGTLNGVVQGDNVAVNATGLFGDKNVGNGKLVAVNGVLTGVDASNYLLSTNATTQANITPKALTGAITAAGKTYDGTTAADTSGSLNGVVQGDTVALSTTGAFADKNAAIGKLVNVSGSLTGADAGNYTVSANGTTVATITPKTITGAITAAGKVYDGSVLASTSGSLAGQILGDVVGLSTAGSFSDKNVGNGKTVNVGGSLTGLDAGNYILAANTTTTANITPKAITGALTAAGKVYDGSRDAATTGTLNGVVQGDNVAVNATGLFGDKNVGNGKLVAVNGVLTGGDAGNYLLSTNATTLANITPKALTGAITAAGKTYDGTTAAGTSGSLNGVVQGDTVALSTTGAFADKNAAIGKLVNVSGSLTGADAGNYTVSANGTTTATIAARQLNGALGALDKVYDGNTVATVTGADAIAGIIAGDSLGVAGSFADKNAGEGKTVAFGLTGGDAGNYVLNAADARAAIARRVLGVDGTTVAGKVYDGSTAAQASAGSLTNLVEGESLGVGTTATFDTANAGNRNANVRYALADGDNGLASNYVLADTQHQAVIDRRAITVAADDKTKRAGDVDPALTWRVTQGNLVGNDTLAGLLNRAAGETAGNYVIGAGGLSNSNYLVAAQDGTLVISNAVQPDSRREAALSAAQWLQAAVGTANTTPPTLPGELNFVPVDSGNPGQTGNAKPVPNAGQGARSMQGPAQVLVIDGGIRLPEGVVQGGI